VTIYESDRYARDDAKSQAWANFLASLVHGPELAKVILYLAPLDEVQSLCGPSAAACYGGRNSTIVASPDPLPDGTSPQSIIAHEYGHHVAANRSNAPWSALDYGTKRWASYEQICAGTVSGRFFPGNESDHYQLNPGEAFAETYRVLNEQRLGLVSAPWDVVDQSFFPDATALALVQQDVLTPWQAATVTRTSGHVTRSVVVRTPLDGRLQVSFAVERARAAHAGAAACEPSARCAAAGRPWAVDDVGHDGVRHAVLHRSGRPDLGHRFVSAQRLAALIRFPSGNSRTKIPLALGDGVLYPRYSRSLTMTTTPHTIPFLAQAMPTVAWCAIAPFTPSLARSCPS
jgi:hypothetical protein